MRIFYQLHQEPVDPPTHTHNPIRTKPTHSARSSASPHTAGAGAAGAFASASFWSSASAHLPPSWWHCCSFRCLVVRRPRLLLLLAGAGAADGGGDGDFGGGSRGIGMVVGLGRRRRQRGGPVYVCLYRLKARICQTGLDPGIWLDSRGVRTHMIGGWEDEGGGSTGGGEQRSERRPMPPLVPRRWAGADAVGAAG